ncbi:MAG: MFS transporter [Nonomuraea sp.]|nr:MFS transporter [Nonomuraea sp.]
MALRERLAALRAPGVPRVLLLTALGMAAAYTAYAYVAPALGPQAAAPLLFLYGLGAILGNFLAGYATDRWNAMLVLRIGYAAMALSMAGLALFPELAWVLMFAWGASSWCQTPPQQHRLIGIAPREAALLVSLNSSCIYLGIGAGTLLGGLVLPAVFAVGALLAVLALGWTLAGPYPRI